MNSRHENFFDISSKRDAPLIDYKRTNIRGFDVPIRQLCPRITRDQDKNPSATVLTLTTRSYPVQQPSSHADRHAHRVPGRHFEEQRVYEVCPGSQADNCAGFLQEACEGCCACEGQGHTGERSGSYPPGPGSRLECPDLYIYDLLLMCWCDLQSGPHTNIRQIRQCTGWPGAQEGGEQGSASRERGEKKLLLRIEEV